LGDMCSEIASKFCNSHMFAIGHYKHSSFMLDNEDIHNLFDIAMYYTKHNRSAAVVVHERSCLIIESCVLAFALLRPSDWDAVTGHTVYEHDTNSLVNQTLLMTLFRQAFAKLVYEDYFTLDEFSLDRHFFPIQWDTSEYKAALIEKPKGFCEMHGPFGTILEPERPILHHYVCDVVDVPKHIVQDAMLAFCMGNHKRLGSESALSYVDADIFSLVFESVLLIDNT
jgi:hypothetical protein